MHLLSRLRVKSTVRMISIAINSSLLIISFIVQHAYAQTQKGGFIAISIEKRVRSSTDTGAFAILNEVQQWNPTETAIVICDMWDEHWCKGATSRVAEMAPRLNKVISEARDKGMLIVHSPSDCMTYYKGHAGRKLAQQYSCKKYAKQISQNLLPAEKNAVWPIDQSDEGCDDSVRCEGGSPWRKQIDALEIKEGDAISDDGAEIAGLFEKKGIKNVILTGVHTNMCVIGRSFGLRNMVRLGKNVVLMRDMTDAMYNSKMRPVVNHFTGVDLVIEYIEKYVCPSMLSTDIVGGRQFRFSTDTRPVVAFITAEGEYRANEKLPAFADSLMLHEGVRCEFAIGKPAMDGPGRHNIENLQILEDASLAVFFVRRVALEPAKMELIKRYVQSGKPVLGIRTASHSFNANGTVPREGGAIVAAKENADAFLAQWTEFDNEVIGGNYQGHYPAEDVPTRVMLEPGMVVMVTDHRDRTFHDPGDLLQAMAFMVVQEEHLSGIRF